MAQNFVGSNNINLLVPQGPAPPLPSAAGVHCSAALSTLK